MVEDCGECKGLINMVEGGFSTCTDFCNSVGRSCINAIVAEEDNCAEEVFSTCSTNWGLSSAIICECSKTTLVPTETPTTAPGKHQN